MEGRPEDPKLTQAGASCIPRGVCIRYRHETTLLFLASLCYRDTLRGKSLWRTFFNRRFSCPNQAEWSSSLSAMPAA